MTQRSTIFLWVVVMGLIPTSVHARMLTIVCLGDSTTAGTPYGQSPLEAPPNGAGAPESFYGYWIHRAEPTWTVLNQGVNGETTQQIRERLDGAIKPHPQYVVVLAGVNDIYQGQPTEATEGNLRAIYDAVRHAKGVPIAATVLPFDRATPAQADGINSLNTWILKTAHAMKIPTVDLNRVVTDPQRPNHLRGSPEGLHPDMASYQKMGEAVLAKLLTLETP